MGDTIGMNNLNINIPPIDMMGATIICAHTGFDEQGTGKGPLHNLVELKTHAKRALVAVAGGVNLSNIGAILDLKPDIIIIGSAIMASAHRKDAAIKFKKIISQQ